MIFPVQERESKVNQIVVLFSKYVLHAGCFYCITYNVRVMQSVHVEVENQSQNIWVAVAYLYIHVCMCQTPGVHTFPLFNMPLLPSRQSTFSL